MKFKFPPINELVIGVYFSAPLLAMRAEHVGLFWHSVRAKFPRASQTAPIVSAAEGIPPAMLSTNEEIYPLPRFWFATADETMLIQLQRNAFLLNWRKRDQVYPHFDNVKREFDAAYAIFADFARSTLQQDFAIETAELTYINLTTAGDYWPGINQISAIIPSFRPIDVGLSNAQLVSANQSTVWNVATDLSLTAKLQTGALTADKRAALIFELSAKGRLGAATKSEADAWFTRAHGLTGQAFKAMTSPDIQARVWQPIDGGS